jgi:arylsulfatase A-like enzyme
MPLTSALLGAETVRFSRGFVTTSLCCPSRSSILTGLYAHNHGVLTNSLPNGGAQKFDPTSTLATWLQAAGYRTALIGKYLNQYDKISPAIPPGWDQFQALTYATLQYYNYDLNDNGTVVHYGSATDDYVTDVLTARAVQFIQTSPPRQPIFLFYTPTAPHGPATPALTDVGRFDSFPNWRPPSFNEADVSDKPSWVKVLPKITASQMTTADAFHRNQLESLQAVDRGVAGIIAALQQSDRWSNTLVVFLSDNGFMWGEHRLNNRKICPYEECIRVPIWVRMPGVVARTDTNLVANIDLAPTIAAWAGLPAPAHVNGLNLLPLLQNPGTVWRTSLLIEHLGSGSAATNSSGVRTPRYMYNQYQNGNKELYDLVTDSLQLTNVASKASNAVLIASLKVMLDALRRE